MHACHSINAMPLRLVGEVCRGKGNMALEHPCKAFLLVVGRSSKMNCPSHIGCPIPILCPTVHQVKLVPCDPSCSLFSWSVVDNCPVWPNRAGKSGFILLKYIYEVRMKTLWMGKRGRQNVAALLGISPICRRQSLQSPVTVFRSIKAYRINLFLIHGAFKPAEVLAQCSRVSIVG